MEDTTYYRSFLVHYLCDLIVFEIESYLILLVL